MAQELYMVGLKVKDMPRSQDFYRRLGLALPELLPEKLTELPPDTSPPKKTRASPVPLVTTMLPPRVTSPLSVSARMVPPVVKMISPL